MYEELKKQLKELGLITEFCGEQRCFECKNKDLCDKYENKMLSDVYKNAARAIERLELEVAALQTEAGGNVMGKEYIEREAAYPLAKKICDAIDSEDFQRLNFGMRILDWIDDLPAADLRPLVMCKDCDCWNDWDSAGKESLGNYVCSCAHWSVEDGPILYTRPTDFCSYGEKREES